MIVAVKFTFMGQIDMFEIRKWLLAKDDCENVMLLYIIGDHDW